MFFLNFSFSSRTLRKENPFLFLFSKVENEFYNFSFSSRTLRQENHFLFLFSKMEKRNSNFSFSSRLDFFSISLMPGTDICRENSGEIVLHCNGAPTVGVSVECLEGVWRVFLPSILCPGHINAKSIEKSQIGRE